MTESLFSLLRLDQSIGLVAIAESDLSAARTLHATKHYPQAVFSLQQAVEKTIKAAGLATRVIAPNQLQREISHKAIRVYAEALQKAMANPALQDESARPQLLLTAAYAKRLAEQADEFSDVSRPTADELAQWLRACSGTRSDTEAFVLESAKSVDSALAALPTVLGLESDATAFPRAVYTTMAALFDLYWLALATLAHAIASRYGEEHRSPQDLYNERTPLVVRLPEIADAVANCQHVVRQGLSLAQKLAAQMSEDSRSGTETTP